jgi:chromosome segregation ATPase
MKNRLCRVFEMEQTELFCVEFQKLDLCYRKLLQAITDVQSDPEKITKLADEAAKLIVELAGTLPNLSETEQKSQLEWLFHQLQQVIAVTEGAMSKLHQALRELNTGKQAIRSYRSPAVGIGYTEGTFLDQKK